MSLDPTHSPVTVLAERGIHGPEGWLGGSGRFLQWAEHPGHQFRPQLIRPLRTVLKPQLDPILSPPGGSEAENPASS